MLDFHNDVHGWRVSKCDDQTAHLTITSLQRMNLSKYLFMKAMIEVEDEYNTDAIVEKTVDKKQVMIRGTAPGTGKSYICKRMAELGHKVVFVCPTNRLSQEFEGEV